MRRIISMLLQNEAGALARVAGMFAARGYNIDSLTVAATQDAEVSRLTLVTSGDEIVIDQIIKQSRKLIDVIEIADLTSREHLEFELLIVKVGASADKKTQLAALMQRYPRAILVDEGHGSITVQIAGTGVELNRFLGELTLLATILDVARSGTAALNCDKSTGVETSRLTAA
ncbi:MAG: acetolactate synthase small subunit [Rudaea sp.]